MVYGQDDVVFEICNRQTSCLLRVYLTHLPNKIKFFKFNWEDSRLQGILYDDIV